MRNVSLLGLITLVLGLLTPLSAAQPMGMGGSVSVSANAWWAPRQADEGPLVALVAVTMDHPPGLHSWPSEDQDVLPSDVASFAIRTTATLRTSDAVLRVGTVQWPSPSLQPVPDPMGSGNPIEVPVYAGKAVVFVPVLIDRDAAGEARTLELVVSYQACDETVCFPPENAKVMASLPAFGEGVPPAEASGLEEATLDTAIALAVRTAGGDDLPAPPEMAEGDGPLPAGVAEPSRAAAAPALAGSADTRNKFLGFVPVPTPDSAGGIIAILALGVVGGFVLNLTPCVLPVIPIKVMTLSQHAGSPGKTLMLGLWMALGVVAFWVGLGIPAALLGKTVGAVFGVWWFTAGVGIIIAIMSLGLMGLFTIQLPQSVYKVNPRADSPWGSFVFGVMTGVLGLPCFGLVAGALLVSATKIPPAITMLIFAALGVGMALPYLILSMNPKWVNVLPRTGPASELVKQVMGLLLLGAGAYFLASGLQGLTKSMPWIGGQMQWWAGAIFIAMACFWLIVRTFQITPSPVRRGSFAVLGVLGASLPLWFAYGATKTAHEQYLNPTWVDYSPQVLADARASGAVVVVDFTADWCINCKVLESGVLSRDPVHSRLRDDDVVAIRVDLTDSGMPGWKLMKDFNQIAPPVLAVYGPGIDGDTPWMANNYTSGIVMDAIALGKGKASPQDLARAN